MAASQVSYAVTGEVACVVLSVSRSVRSPLGIWRSGAGWRRLEMDAVHDLIGLLWMAHDDDDVGQTTGGPLPVM